MLAKAQQIALQEQFDLLASPKFSVDSINKEVEEWFQLNQEVVYQSVLDVLIRYKWDLIASEIKELTGSSPRVPKGQSYWRYGSYLFTRFGKRGRHISYRIQKIDPPRIVPMENIQESAIVS